MTVLHLTHPKTQRGDFKRIDELIENLKYEPQWMLSSLPYNNNYDNEDDCDSDDEE